jgi:phosphohistidine phosphatase
MATPITLYVVRHAVAAERSDEYPDDTKRPLTPEGIARFREAVEGLAALGVRLDQVLTSPLVRARQTADILAEILPGRPPIVELKALAPGNTAAAVVAALGEYSRRSSLALVGHEPGVGELAARLVGARAPFVFKKGAVCRIDAGALPLAGPGELRWFATPRMLRKLAK